MPQDLHRFRKNYSSYRVQPRYEVQYVVDEALDWKNSVRVASTGNVNLSGTTPLSVDSVALANGDRVLLKNQGTGSENGIYVFEVEASNYVFSRASDANSETLSTGAATYVEEGTTNAQKIYILSTTGDIVVGSTSITWTQFSGGGGGTPGGSDTYVQFNDGGSFGGDSDLRFNKTTGALTGTYILATTGFTGSLTRLIDGTPYIVAGPNITINTGSNGAIQITGSAGGGGGGNDYWVSTTTNAIYSTGSVAIRGGLSIDAAADIGGDVFFFVSGSITGSGVNDKKAVFGGDVRMSGSLEVSGDQVEITGSLRVTNGISGSLTKLTDGTSYLIAGPNITINTGSNGAVQITGSAGGGGVSGTGTAYKHARFSAASTIENSLLEDGRGDGPIGLPLPGTLNFLTSSAEGFHFPSAQRWTVAPSNTRALVINENGFVFNASARSVGIGTANPANPLHITHTSFGSNSAFISDSMQTIRLQNTSTTAGNSAAIVNIGNVGIGNSSINAHISFINLAADSAAIAFGTSENASTFGERMRIDNIGNVGINTDSPTEKLHIKAGNIKVDSAGYGIRLPLSPSNSDVQTLDCYEERTLTVTLGSGTNNGQILLYSAYDDLLMTRVGRKIHISGYLKILDMGTASGDMWIELGTAVGERPTMKTPATVIIEGGVDWTGIPVATVDNASSRIYLRDWLNGSSNGHLASILPADTEIMISATYSV